MKKPVKYIAIPKKKNSEPFVFMSLKEICDFFQISMAKAKIMLREGIPLYLGDKGYYLDEDLN